MFVSKPKPTAASSQARAIAHRGVSGKRTDTRWKAELMHTFGPKAEHVEFHGDPVARAACEQLGVRAYAFGDRVATRESSPPLRVAAHEAYHVLHSRADADANEEARAHDSERVALAGNTIEANAPARAPSTRPPLSFYEEWNYDSPSYAESPKWIPGLNYKGEGVRLSDDGNIAIKQDTKKTSTRQQYIYSWRC